MTDSDTSESTIPDEPQFQYVVGQTRTVAEDVAAYYDAVVEVPPGTPEDTIITQAAETVASNIAPVTVDDLTPTHHELEVVVLDATYREQVPATLVTIEFVEQIRYEHDGRQCEGALFDIEASTDESSRLEGLVVATQIDGTPTDDQTVHRIPLGNINAHLEARDE